MTAESERKPRLRRLEGVYVRSPIYFVTACTAERKPLLANESIHQAFVTYSRQAEKHGTHVGAYVLMPDHMHLFVHPSDLSPSLETWIKSLKNSLSKILRATGRSSPHWQKGFFDHVLRSGESYSQKWHYVRNNPVRAKLVSEWEDWPYVGEIHPLEYTSNR